MRRIATVLTAGILAISCSDEPAQRVADSTAPEAPPPSAYLAGTNSRVITSSRTGRPYQISVAVPRGYASSSRSYPVLYALDANGEFGLVVETARLMQLEDLIPELVIVGIGYPVGHYFDAVGKRAFDLTVAEDRTWRWPPPNAPPGLPPLDGTGGAPGFLSFLTEELMPTIEGEYRIDSQDRALFGHSFGGLFTFYALLHSQGKLHRYIASSPALWWANRISFKHEAAFASANKGLHARAFFSAGLLEPSETEPGGGYVRDLKDLAAVFERRRYEGLEWRVRLVEGETHMSVLPGAISMGLRYIYGPK